MNWLRWWEPVFTHNRWLLFALGAATALLVVIGAVRATCTIREFGFRSYVKSTFTVDNDTWRLIGVLLLMVTVVVMVFYYLA